MGIGQKIKNFFLNANIASEETFDELTDLLIESDIGAKISFEIAESLREVCRKRRISSQEETMAALKELVLPMVKEEEPSFSCDKTNIVLLLGVNGVGKTTCAAKLAQHYIQKGFPKERIIFACADTFRAGAIEQLQIHGEKLGIRTVAHQAGSDPASVVFDAAEACKAKGGGLIFADSAGRLHNKENLVKELKKIDRICADKADTYKKILVVDGTTGSNATRQAEVFNEAVGIDCAVITKFDSTAKGGVAVSIGKGLGIPVAFLGTGEKYGDLIAFNAKEYVESLFN